MLINKNHLNSSLELPINAQASSKKKLLLLPGGFNYLGGTLVSLLSLVKGFAATGALENLCVLVWSDSLTEKFLRDLGYSACMKLIPAPTQTTFFNRAWRWINQQPKDYPLLLDNLSDWYVMPHLMLAAPAIRHSGRPVYHFCHDLIMSYNILGEFLRKMGFLCMNPQAICNSQFTAGHIRRLMPNIRGIIYQPVDTDRFNQVYTNSYPPENLRPILNSGMRVMLTPSRLSKPGVVNDKNLRSLIPVLVFLKQMGHFYHGVVIGPDESPDKTYTHDLQAMAAAAGVADRFTILPPVLNIEDYYKYADIVVTLAPREPFGRTVVEAIACGVPVIGSCTGGIHEILQQFAPEWTVNPDNPVSVAQAIIRVTNDTATSDLLRKGQAWVETHCKVANYAQNMMQLTGLSH